MRLCEITMTKEGRPEAGKRPDLLHRKIEVPELKTSIRLKISSAGLKLLDEAGGLAKFLAERDEKKLSSKLSGLKQKLIKAGAIKVQKEEPKKVEEAAAEAGAEAAKTEEAPQEEVKPEEPAKAAEAPQEEEAPKAEAKSEEEPVEAKPAAKTKEKAKSE